MDSPGLEDRVSALLECVQQSYGNFPIKGAELVLIQYPPLLFARHIRFIDNLQPHGSFLVGDVRIEVVCLQ